MLFRFIYDSLMDCSLGLGLRFVILDAVLVFMFSFGVWWDVEFDSFASLLLPFAFTLENWLLKVHCLQIWSF